MNQSLSLSSKTSIEKNQRMAGSGLQQQKPPSLEFAGANRFEKKDSASDTQKYIKPKNQSFSDMLSPDQVHTKIDLSLEKELEKHKQAVGGGTVNKLEKSILFDESSIKKNSVDINSPAHSPEKADAGSFFNEEVNRVLLRAKNTFCILCGKSGEDFPEDQLPGARLTNKNEDNNKNDRESDIHSLIHPCLCNFKSHRECLKAHVIISRKAGCDRCKVLYAISPQKLSLSPRRNRKGFSIFLLEIVVIVVVIGLFIFTLRSVVKSHNDGTINPEPLFVILVIFCLFIILATIFGGLVCLWRKYFAKKTQDLIVYCKQTEIAFHVDNSDRILKAFLEQELHKKSSEKLLHAQKMYEKFDIARFNNAMSLRNIEEQIYKKTFRKKTNSKALKDSLVITEFSRKSVIKISMGQNFHVKNISDSQILQSFSKSSLSDFQNNQSGSKSQEEEEKNVENAGLGLPTSQDLKVESVTEKEPEVSQWKVSKRMASPKEGNNIKVSREEQKKHKKDEGADTERQYSDD